jgi:hypothetical protein
VIPDKKKVASKKFARKNVDEAQKMTGPPGSVIGGRRRRRSNEEEITRKKRLRKLRRKDAKISKYFS